MSAAGAIDACLRTERGRILSALIARIGDFQIAEDALQEAAASALVHWGRSGVPLRPDAWLIRVGLRKALDRLRGATREGRKAANWALLAEEEAALPEKQPIPDERLRLIFTCCHPALDGKSRVALTLRTLCGLTTAEIARLYLDAEPTMGQRISRAKAKIAAAGIPFAVPDLPALPARLDAVLSVIYLIYTLGHQTGAGPRDLRSEAIWLARLVDGLMPGVAEAEAALALLLLTEARQPARVAGGVMVPLSEQDRGRWDRDLLAEGQALLDRAIARGGSGPFRIKAAIAALHGAAPDHAATDWRQIAALYRALLRIEPTDVVRLNVWVSIAAAGHARPALRAVEAMAERLDGYQPFHAARAHLRRLAGEAGAREEFRRAATLSLDPAERCWLERQAELA